MSSERIPAVFSGFRIAQISDLHNDEFGENNEKLIGLLEESKPDIIVVTGDLVDATRTNLRVAFHFIEEAVRIAPVYYVTGNHEAGLPQYNVLKAGLEERGAAVLENEKTQLSRDGETITLAGLSDFNFMIQSGEMSEISAMTEKKLKELTGADRDYTILLSHHPELFETYADCEIDLVFTGHAHGGQFRLPFAGGIFAPNQGFFPKYDAGMYVKENTKMVVSRGIGNSTFPLRFNNRPEIVLVALNDI